MATTMIPASPEVQEFAEHVELRKMYDEHAEHRIENILTDVEPKRLAKSVADLEPFSRLRPERSLR